MVLKNTVRSFALATTLSCAVLIPSFAQATEVNYALAQNRTAVMAELEQVGVPLSDAEAREVRGSGWFINILTGAVVGTTALKIYSGGSLCTTGYCAWLPWFIKPIYAY